MNPLTLLDTILGDWATPRVRRAVHNTILLVVVIAGIWLESKGDWKEALGALVAAIYAAANRANTPVVDLDPPGSDTEPDDGLSYKDAGGGDFPED